MSTQLEDLVKLLKARCPYCHEEIDDKHTVDEFRFGDSIQIIVGCPKHPNDNRITVVPR